MSEVAPELSLFLTPEEAAELLGTTSSAVLAAVTLGLIQARRFGKHVRIPRRALGGVTLALPKPAPSQTPSERQLADRKNVSVYWRKNAEYRATYSEKKRHKRSGHSPELVAKLRTLQKEACAVCRVAFTAESHRPNSEHADHDHATGQPRGLLCSVCNTTLGFYEKYQKPRGVRFAPFDRYLRTTPVSKVET